MSEPRCREPANALLPWYLSGSLSREDEVRVRDHVEGCDVCSAELDDLRGSLLPAPASPPVAASRPGPALPPAPAGRSAIAYALPAVLMVPALLGLYWIYLGLPSGPGPSPSAIRRSVALDLGDGASESGEIPSLAVPPGAETVVLSFRGPADPAGRASIALEGPGGATLARLEIEAPPDPGGRLTCAIDAALLRAPGRYRILLARTGEPVDPDRGEYPLEILPAPSP